MTLLNSGTIFLLQASSLPESMSRLRWELTAIAVGVALLCFGIAGIVLFFLRQRTSDRSLIYFGLFALLYAIRLILRQGLFESLIPVQPSFWNYSDAVIDNFIVVPLTLFLIEIVQPEWQRILRWVLAFQIIFASGRFLFQILDIGSGPRELAYHIVIVAYCSLLFVYPVWLAKRGLRMPRDWRLVYAGFAVFGLFVIYSNLLDLKVTRGRDLEPIGFLVFACCLGYVAASRAYSNEQRLYTIQKELEIARQIQSSILPREVPRISGLEIAARYVPMAAVAGDFYDFLVLDEMRFGILVADVTGHGVPAALIAAMLKSALTAQSVHADDPVKVLTGLNEALCGKFEEHFVTAGYLFVDTEKQTMRYGGAGHPPLFWGSADGGRRRVFRDVEANGMMLGVFEGASYSRVELSINPGDRCVLYTDGVLEAKNSAEEEFGAARLRGFLERESDLAPGPLIAALFSELARWSGRTEGTGAEDDITLIAVDFRAS